MAEYIERDALMEHIEQMTIIINGLREGKGILAEFGIRYRNSILRAINDFPAADVVEVKHGRWVQVICYEEFEDGFVDRVKECCSVCHTPNGRRMSNYCPY